MLYCLILPWLNLSYVRPSLTGKHWCEGEKNRHCYGESLSNAGWGEEESKPGDEQEYGGLKVGLPEVIHQLPAEHNLQYEARVVEVVVVCIVTCLEHDSLELAPF